MSRHPLDNCDPARRLDALVAAETEKTARKISQQDATDTVFESALDDILGSQKLNLDLTIVDCDYDPDTGTLHIMATLRSDAPVDHIKLHIVP